MSKEMVVFYSRADENYVNVMIKNIRSWKHESSSRHHSKVDGCRYVSDRTGTAVCKRI